MPKGQSRLTVSRAQPPRAVFLTRSHASSSIDRRGCCDHKREHNAETERSQAGTQRREERVLQPMTQHATQCSEAKRINGREDAKPPMLTATEDNRSQAGRDAPPRSRSRSRTGCSRAAERKNQNGAVRIIGSQGRKQASGVLAEATRTQAEDQRSASMRCGGET